MRVFSFYTEARQKTVDGIFYCKVCTKFFFHAGIIGKIHSCCSMIDTDACYRIEGNKRTVVFASVIVGTLHECALREEIAYLEIGAYRSM